MMIDTIRELDRRVRELEREIARRAREDADARRRMTIPGIGPIRATAILALALPSRSRIERTCHKMLCLSIKEREWLT